MVLLQADVLELKANPDKQAKGTASNPILVDTGTMINCIDNYIDEKLTKNNKIGNM